MFQSYKDWIENSSYILNGTGDFVESCCTFEDWMQGLHVDDSDESEIDIETSEEYIKYLLDENDKGELPLGVSAVLLFLMDKLMEQAQKSVVEINICSTGICEGGEYTTYDERLSKSKLPEYVMRFAKETKCYMGILHAMLRMHEKFDEIYPVRLGCAFGKTIGLNGLVDNIEYADDYVLYTSNIDIIREFVSRSFLHDIFWHAELDELMSPEIRVVNICNGNYTYPDVDDVIAYYFNSEIYNGIINMIEEVWKNTINYRDGDSAQVILNMYYKMKMLGINDGRVIDEIIKDLYEYNKKKEIRVTIDKEHLKLGFVNQYINEDPYYFTLVREWLVKEDMEYVVCMAILDLYERKYTDVKHSDISGRDEYDENDIIIRTYTLK